MNSSRSTLITAFFKSPPLDEGEGVSLTTPTTSRGGDECSWCSGESGEGVGRFSVNLSGLLNSQVSCGDPQDATPLSTVPIPYNNHENGTTLPAILGTGMRQGTLSWDASSGTLALKSPATPPHLTTPHSSDVLVSRHSTEANVMVTKEKEGGGEVEGCDIRRRQRKKRQPCRVGVTLDNGTLEGECTEVRIKGRGRKRSKRTIHTEEKKGKRRLCGEKELLVRIKRCLLSQLPRDNDSLIAGLHSEPEPGNVVMGGLHSEPDHGGDVEITHSVRPVDCLDESVILVSASPPLRLPHPPPLLRPPAPSTLPCPPAPSTLSGAWAKIFNRPGPSVATSLNNNITNSVSRSSVSVSPVCSPKKCRPSSPLRRSLSRSPRTRRSPRPHSPLRSPWKGSSTSASPLRCSIKPRKLVALSPPMVKRPRHQYDSAPFSSLVHIRQDCTSDLTSTLTSTKPAYNLKPVTIPSSTLCRPQAHQFNLKSCLASTEGQTSAQSDPLLAVVTADQRACLLDQLVDAHPQERVRKIFQRYCRIRAGNTTQNHTLPTPPHIHTVTPPHIHTVTSTIHDTAGGSKRSNRKPLVCRIHILNSTHQVDVGAYTGYKSCGKTRGRRSLRLASGMSDSAPGKLPAKKKKKKNRQSYKSAGSNGLGPSEMYGERKRRLSSKVAGSSEAAPYSELHGERRDDLHQKRKRKRSRAGSDVAAIDDDEGEEGEGEEEPGFSDLWSELYRPQTSADVIGNKENVQRLFSWLQTWKNKCSSKQNAFDHISLPDRRKRKRRTCVDVNRDESRGSRENSPTPEWARGGQGSNDFISLTHLRRHRQRRKLILQDSSSEEEGEEEEGEGFEMGEGVSSVVLLCGGVGCGKTAAVYTCAAELGCKVFEVNSSTVRSRGNLLTTLKEATLSHQVSTQPTVSSSSLTHCMQPRHVTPRTGPGMHSASERGKKVGGKDGLLSFFKPQNQREDDIAEGEMRVAEGSRLVSLETSTVILLEEVDILFDSDRGFWSGVYELIETTRRPLILTANDSRYDLDCDHIKIVFQPPSLVELGMHMQLLCLSHDYHMTSEMAVQLADSLHADIRRVFLSLQFLTTIVPTSTTHTLTPPTPHSSLSHIPVIEPASRSTLLSTLPPDLSLPWRPIRHHPLTTDDHRGPLRHHPPTADDHRGPLWHPQPTTDDHRDIDMAAHCAEQHSYVDIIAMETGSRDHHMRQLEDIIRPWWACPAEPSGSLDDELPVGECRWGEEDVNCALCEEVERGGGVRSEPSAVVWTEFTRHVESVRQCLEKCVGVFGLHSNRVGVATDSLPFLRTICSDQLQRQMNKTKRRFRHYLQSCTVDQSYLKNLPLLTRFTNT